VLVVCQPQEIPSFLILLTRTLFSVEHFPQFVSQNTKISNSFVFQNTNLPFCPLFVFALKPDQAKSKKHEAAKVKMIP
jgi:hypothetical protein